MRPALLAVPLCLLAASAAAAQGPAGPAPTGAPPAARPPAQLPTSSLDPAPPPAAGNHHPTASPLDGIGCDTPSPYYGPQAYGSLEYLLWFITPTNTPDLIQSVGAGVAAGGGVLPPGAAARVFPETRQLEFGAFSGLRATLGYSFDRLGVEWSGFYLAERTKSATLSSDGTIISVAQPYISAGSGQNTSLFASLAGQYVGGVAATAESRVWGMEGNVRFPWYAFLTNYTHGLVGFRYLDLEESLDLTSRSTFPNGGTISIRDTIRTRNQFYGAQVGLDGRIGGMERGLGLQVAPKLAIGGMRQQADLLGANVFQNPGLPADVQAGGLYARGANLGSFSRDKFAFLCSLDVNVTYNFTEAAQVFVGYSIIYTSTVLRPGEQIDLVVNDSRARFVANPTPSDANRPAQRFVDNDFWLQGINFGLRLQY